MHARTDGRHSMLCNMQQSARQQGLWVFIEKAVMMAKSIGHHGSNTTGHDLACMWTISLPKLKKLGLSHTMVVQKGKYKLLVTVHNLCTMNIDLLTMCETQSPSLQAT